MKRELHPPLSLQFSEVQYVVSKEVRTAVAPVSTVYVWLDPPPGIGGVNSGVTWLKKGRWLQNIFHLNKHLKQNLFRGKGMCGGVCGGGMRQKTALYSSLVNSYFIYLTCASLPTTCIDFYVFQWF
jgi:hypothetical protein